MATHTYKKCPHCGKTYETYSTYTKAHMNHSGSPFVVCKSCGRTFVDRDIKEPALSPYSDEGFELWRCFFVYLMPWGLLGVFILFCALNMEDPSAAVYFFAALVLGLYVVLTANVVINRTKLQEKYKEEYRESEKRLQNPQYAQALSAAGFYVPRQYLNSCSPINDRGGSIHSPLHDTSKENSNALCLADYLKYALKFETDDGLKNYLLRIMGTLSSAEQDVLCQVLNSPQDKWRTLINDYLQDT